MAIVALYEAAGTISATEISLPNATTYAAGSAIATDGIYQIFLDLNAMAAGDMFELKVYEKVQAAGTQRIVCIFNFVGVQAAPHTVLPTFIFMHGWDVTLKKITGTDRSLAWSIRQVA